MPAARNVGFQGPVAWLAPFVDLWLPPVDVLMVLPFFASEDAGMEINDKRLLVWVLVLVANVFAFIPMVDAGDNNCAPGVTNWGPVWIAGVFLAGAAVLVGALPPRFRGGGGILVAGVICTVFFVLLAMASAFSSCLN